MTLPRPDRTCKRCEFNGDVELFWRIGADGEYIRSDYTTVPLDMLRYGRSEAEKYAYHPHRLYCPRCGYDFDSFDKAVEAASEARFAARKRAQQERANNPGCAIVIFALPAASYATWWWMHAT